MPSISRRAFLGASLTGLAAGRLFAQDKPAEATPKSLDDAPFQPSTLFLTWQRDPTTTMTIQWIGATGETADTKVSYAAGKASTGSRVSPCAIKLPLPVTFHRSGAAPVVTNSVRGFASARTTTGSGLRWRGSGKASLS